MGDLVNRFLNILGRWHFSASYP